MQVLCIQKLRTRSSSHEKSIPPFSAIAVRYIRPRSRARSSLASSTSTGVASGASTNVTLPFNGSLLPCALALTMSVSWVYDLPFGKGKPILNSSSRAVNAAVSGWKINGMLKYNSGVPLSIAAGAGNLGSVGYSQQGNAVSGVSPYLTTNPRDFDPATSKYLNSAAFTTSTGFNFGNLAPTLSWVRGFWGKSEMLTLGRDFKVKERTTLEFSVDAMNPFNFVRWANPNTGLVNAAFGKVTAVQTPGTGQAQPGGRTLQVNAALKF